MVRTVRIAFLTIGAAALLASAPVAADAGLVGRYRVAEGPDVAGELLIAADGRFAYVLAAGALDERANGTWTREGGGVCLTTRPQPVPPTFRRLARSGEQPGGPTVLVTWPDGRGIAGVDVRVGFDAGDPLDEYTQEDGWSLPPGERRSPRWIELREPIQGFASPRFELTAKEAGTLRVVLEPNDLGVVDFRGACLEPVGKGFVLRRGEGTMRFVRAED